MTVARAWRGGPAARLFANIGLALAAKTATAMGGLVMLEPPPEHDTQVAVGGSLWRLHTLATDQPPHQTLFYPAVDLQRPDGLFASTDTGVGWNLSKSEETQFGIRLSPWPKRRAERLTVGSRVEQGLFFNRMQGKALLWQFSTRHGGGLHRDGWITEAGVTSGVPLGFGAPLGITLGASWANGRYRTSYSGDGTTLSGGWHDLQAALSYEMRISSEWRLDGQWLTGRTLGPSAPESGRAGIHYQRSFALSLWRDWR